MSKVAVFVDGKVFSLPEPYFGLAEKNGALYVLKLSVSEHTKGNVIYMDKVPEKGLVFYGPRGKGLDTNEVPKEEEVFVYYPGRDVDSRWFEIKEKFPYFIIYWKYNWARVYMVNASSIIDRFFENLRKFDFVNRIRIRGKIFRDENIGMVVTDRYGYVYDGLIMAYQKDKVIEWLKEHNFGVYEI